MIKKFTHDSKIDPWFDISPMIQKVTHDWRLKVDGPFMAKVEIQLISWNNTTK